MAFTDAPNFKRQYWVAIYFYLGMAAAGKACEMLIPSLGAPLPGMIFWLGGLVLLNVGIGGFVVALIWWVVAAIISVSRERRTIKR